MRARKRDRGDGGNRGGNDPGGGNRGGGGGGGGGGRSRKGRGRSNAKRPGGGGGGNPPGRNRKASGPREPDLWGDVAKLPEPRTDVRITDDPAAVPRSLGKPPLPGHEVIAEHYFGVVYERAVMTAGALAAAGGLIDHQALTGESDDT